MNNKFYVYVYLNPMKEGLFQYENHLFGYEPFYIGKGYGQRMYDHLRNGRLKKNSYKNNKIKQIIKLGFNFKDFIIKINQNLSETEAFDLEIKMIKIIGRKDINLGPLLNLTDGGEGKDNPSSETRKKLSIVHKNISNETRKRMIVSHTGKPSGMLGKHHSEETKRKFSLARLGNKHSLGYKHTEYSKNLMSKSRKGVPKSEETKQKMKKPKSSEHIEKLRYAALHRKKKTWFLPRFFVGEFVKIYLIL